MRNLSYGMCLVGLLAAAVSGARSGGPAQPRATIDRAIQALGGEANVGKQKAVTRKGKGTFHGAGQPMPYTAQWAVQLPTQIRFNVESKGGDQTFRLTEVINNDKGWIKVNDAPAMDMSKEQLAEERERLYGEWISTLLPLKDKAFKLTALGDVRVKGHDATGVRVSRQGHRDVSLYFDKASGLPFKTEMQIKEVDKGSDTEIPQAVYQSNYKEIDGVKHAMKRVLERDGKLFVDAEFTEIRPAEKLEASVFAQP